MYHTKLVYIDLKNFLQQHTQRNIIYVYKCVALADTLAPFLSFLIHTSQPSLLTTFILSTTVIPPYSPISNLLTSLFLLSSLFLLTNLPYSLIPTYRPRFASVKYGVVSLMKTRLR